MNRTFLQKAGDFLLGRGFYIVLFLCVATIGITGYFIYTGSLSDTPDTPVTGQAEVVVPDAGKQTPATPSTTPQTPAPQTTSPPKSTTPVPATVNEGSSGTRTQTPPPAEETTQPPEETETQPQTPAQPTVFTWPVKGEVLTGHSLEVLAYDETMGDWRIHVGTDIAAPVGTSVLAACGGTVRTIFEDDMMGTVVVVDHADGLSSVYCNLSAEVTVKEGETVSTGTVIGVVGDTAIAESAQQAHLHLEMVQNGMQVDPVDFLPAR